MKVQKILLYAALSFLLLVAAAFGGALISNHLMSSKLQAYRTNTRPTTKQVTLTSGPASALADFKLAAERSTHAVVHIAAAESDKLAQLRYQRERTRDPFSLFFGDHFFRGMSPNGQQFHRKQGSGSGVIISDDGYIVTNNHVIEYADHYQVTLSDNRTYEAKLVATDPKTDLAVLKIDGKDLPYIEYGDSDNVKVGEWVLAVGNPFSYLTSTVTAGIVSAKGRDLDIIGDGRSSIESFIQTDAAVNGGNSGGALVDLEGRLIGINTAIATPTGSFAGYSFAIPVNLMKKIVQDLIQYGSPQRGYLGIDIVDVDEEVAEKYNLNVTNGVMVYDVLEGGPAEMSGLLPNDVIIEINNIEVSSVPELQEIVGAREIGEDLDLAVVRGGKLMNVVVTIGTRTR